LSEKEKGAGRRGERRKEKEKKKAGNPARVGELGSVLNREIGGGKNFLRNTLGVREGKTGKERKEP